MIKEDHRLSIYERRRIRRRKRAIRKLIKMVTLTAMILIVIVCGIVFAMKEASKDGQDSLSINSLLSAFSQLDGGAEVSGGSISTEVPSWITQDLIPINHYSRPGIALDAVNGVVIHYTGNPGTTAEQNRSYFATLAENGTAYASSHFVIGMDGTIIQCVPLDEVSYCSNDRNNDTISIEVCHYDESGEFTQAAYNSLVKLSGWLKENYDLDISQIIRHYDVTGKECPKYFVDYEDAWYDFLDTVAGNTQ